jgi:hypothetical protein
LACLVAGCDFLDSLYSGVPETYFGGKPLRQFSARDIAAPGSIFRTIVPAPFSSLNEVLPICTSDITWLNPTLQTQVLPDLNRVLTSDAAASLIELAYPDRRFGSVPNYLESVQIQMSGVTRTFIDDSELIRIHGHVLPGCRRLMRLYSSRGHTVLMVQSIVVAKKVKITLQFKQAAIKAGLVPDRATVNGLGISVRDGNKTTHKGADLIVETLYKTIADD